MSWVESEYAGELAVVSAWLAALLPWSISLTRSEGLSLVAVRFPVAVFRFLFGTEVRIDPLIPVWAAPRLEQANASLQTAYYVWLAGAVAIAVAFAFSLLYYRREQLVLARLPLSPVRLMGGLLTVGGGCLLVAAIGIFRSTAGITLPVGSLLVPLLGVTLLGSHTEPSNEE